MADGTNPYGAQQGDEPPAQGWAPDGCSCDNGSPAGCNFKQGDGNVPIHDWTLEETLSAVVMQAELLVITRNTSAIEWNLPRSARLFGESPVRVQMFASAPADRRSCTEPTCPQAAAMASGV